MNIDCKDRDRIFEDGTAADWAVLEAHAAMCAPCAEEVRSWKSLSIAAAELRHYTDSPALWSRIHQALAEQAANTKEQRVGWSWRSPFANLSVSWQKAVATAFVVVLMVSAGWFLRSIGDREHPGILLKSKALHEVQHAESAYVQAIDKLAVEAKPQLESPGTPMM